MTFDDQGSVTSTAVVPDRRFQEQMARATGDAELGTPLEGIERVEIGRKVTIPLDLSTAALVVRWWQQVGAR